MKTNLNNSLESLINSNPDQIGNKVLAAAIAQHKANEEKRQQEQALEQLQQVQRAIDSAVHDVRIARKTVRSVEARLAKIDAAKDAFLKTGDYAAFVKAHREAINSYVWATLNRF